MIRRGGSDRPLAWSARLDPVAALGHRLVGQADDAEIGIPRRDLHLDVDRNSLDALEGDGGDVGNH